jgi:O-antigen ligase
LRKKSRRPDINQASPKKAAVSLVDHAQPAPQSEHPLLVAMACAVALPLMSAYQQPPLPAFFNQALAIVLWSAALLLFTRSLARVWCFGNASLSLAAIASPVALWALLLMTLLAHTLIGMTPGFIAAPIAVNLLLALLLSAAFSFTFTFTFATAAGPRDTSALHRCLHALLIGILIAALFNAVVALMQMTLPRWADDTWIARTVPPHDRASGNVRQPNQLATLMVWGLLAASYFWRQRPLRWFLFSAPLLATLVATGSRTGMVSLLLIVVVALLRSKRVRSWRVKGWLALLIALLPLAWFAESIFTRNTANVALTLRLALWRDVLEIVRLQPWFGVGWGQLNFAWTLTPLPARAAEVFDHAHNLPLHLAAELGVPTALLVISALATLLWRARSALRTSDGATVGLLLATVLLHSLFEYPLWFSYFLLPSAALLAWLVAAGSPIVIQSGATESSSTFRSLKLNNAFAIAAVMSLASVIYATREYQKQVAIHRTVSDPGALQSAISAARESPLYGHFGDYAAIMVAGDAATDALFLRPIRHVLDERLLSAYARMLARTGETDRAAFVIARAREFPPDAATAKLPLRPASSPAAAGLAVQDFRK